MQTRLFVARLPWSVGRDTLKTYFSRYGEVVDTWVVKDRDSGRSKGIELLTSDWFIYDTGYGFVTFAEKQAADEVLAKEHQIEGRTLAVNVAKVY